MTPVVKFIIKQQVFPHFTSTDMTDSMTPFHASLIICKSQVFSGFFTTWCDPHRSVSLWSAWRREASVARKSRRCLVYRCRQRSGGCRGCARMATWRRATSGDHVALRLVCVMSLRVSFHISRNGLCLYKERVHSRQCLQTSAGVWNRAQPPQRPGLRVGGALASEAGDMWVRTAFFVLPSHFRHPADEESAPNGAEQAAPPGVVLVDAATARRDEEAAGSLLARHVSRRFSGHCSLCCIPRFCAVSFGFSQ